MRLDNVDSIIFDFNGTMLDDVDICVDLLNDLLTQHGYKTVTRDRYLEIFTFPVLECYLKAGFHKDDDFGAIAEYFNKVYNERFSSLKIFPDLLPFLDSQKNRRKLAVLSASQQDNLDRQLHSLGIYDYFDDVAGISNIYASSKIEEGKKLFKENGYDKERTIFVGDTLHDYEVAKELGARSILISRGHQNKKRLMEAKDAVILDDFKQLSALLD